MTTDPKLGPFLSSLSEAHRRRRERQEFRDIVADLRREYRWRDQEPTLSRAILGALWEILAPFVRRHR